MLISLFNSLPQLSIFRNAALILLCLAPALAFSAPEEKTKVSKEIKAIDSKIESLSKKNKERKSEINKIEGKLQTLGSQLSKSSSELTRLKRSLGAKEKRSRELKATYKQLHSKLEDEKALLAAHLRSAQINSKKAQARTLINTSPLQQYLRNQHYFGYFQRAQNKAVSEIQQKTLKVDGLKAGLEDELKTLKNLKRSIAKRKAKLAATHKKQKTVVASLTTQQIKDRKRMAELSSNRSKLNDLLEKLQFQSANPKAATDSGFSKLQGKLGWPVKGKITKQRLPGVTIVASEGRAVRAVAGGVIVFAARMRGFGLLAIVDHGGGYMSLYGHNQRLSVKKGTKVEAGSQIAVSGSNQSNGKTGLYFEIRHNATPLDPRDWCKSA